MQEIYLLKSLNRHCLGVLVTLLCGWFSHAQVVLENEIKITDVGLHFDGQKVSSGTVNPGDNAPYDYYFGKNISAHGDCIKTYQDFVFMSWYKGGKENRHVMLTRYNTKTGTQATIEFPHRHTGYQNQYWIGESHNTIGLAVSPIDGTIHMLYDMHAYSRNRPSDGSLSDDYFRYSYSVKDAASVSDAEFTLDKFVENSSGGYKHLSLNGGEDYANFSGLTYPQFFLNDSGDVFMYMREGGNNNGAYKFSKYDANTASWSDFTHFNVLNAKNQAGIDYNWGLYGNMKYVNGKIRIGFQRRSSNNNDKYLYQNGVYYAYSDNQSGADSWKNHQGVGFDLPLYDADKIKVMEPGDYVQTTEKNKVYIVGGFDWTVTDKGDVHIISQVKDNQYNVTKYLHTYKPAGAADFITSEDFSGGEAIYTAGENIYLIGLKNGRVYVEKATGGSNNFTRVYEATSGKTFDHGAVHIKDGMLYYYLMENKSGNAQPLYLQIIDLDIDLDPFRVSLTKPFDGETYHVDESIAIEADAIDENGSVSKVEFLVNGSVVESDFSAPYATNWMPTQVGTYNIQAVAYNAANDTVSSSEIMVNIEVHDPTDLTGTVYRLKNVATGMYLESEDADVIASHSSDGIDKEWEFVKAGNYYNIDSKTTRGIIRAAGNPVGEIINTGFAPPREDSDKQWVVIYETDNSYRFQTRNATRYLSHNANGLIEHTTNLDDRSKWILEDTTLSIEDVEKMTWSVIVYPNPVKDNFNIMLKGLNHADIIINDMLGKIVYRKATSSKNIKIENDGRFKSGIYLIKVVSENQNVFNSKLVVK